MDIFMFGKKKRSWYWLAMWSLVFSAIVYSVSRFFLHAVNKDAGKSSSKKSKKNKKPTSEELFI
jgi:phosphotransferase system  glucose/maltose/N-acetylglucosamine-specific IIC component